MGESVFSQSDGQVLQMVGNRIPVRRNCRLAFC